MAIITFKPKHLSKKLLSSLKDRSLDVIVNRYGLNDDAERLTLEAIGQKYGITRERVRQIENAAINSIKKSKEFEEFSPALEELKQLISDLGSVVHEEELLSHVSKDDVTKNHIHFYLVLGDSFKKHKEDKHFNHRWSVDDKVAETVHKALKSLYESLSNDEIISEKDIVSRLLDNLKDISEEYKNEEILKRWLKLSKVIDKNPIDEWGKANSKNIKLRGVKDYIYLVLRKHGEPMHFRDVADAITKTFGKKTLAATTHNELIKDPRFVLVGRGQYALKEWGYKPGIVRDVIKSILKTKGPMHKEEIVDSVMQERFLKKNTILVNLQNGKYFKKLPDGRYDNVK